MKAKWLLVSLASCLLAACAAAPTPTPTPRPVVTDTSPAAAPTPDAPELAAPGDVLAALHWEEAPALSELPLQVLAGWQAGLRAADYCEMGPYRWLDGEHLLVLPVVGQSRFDDVTDSVWAHPVVASVLAGEAWALAQPQEFCALPAWSAALQRVIEVAGDTVQLRDLAGGVSASYAGGLPLSLAPSGLRLVANDVWIDLQSEQTAPLSASWQAAGYSKIAWSADEQRIFGCCFHYADAQSGERWEQESFPGFTIGGRGSWPGEEVYSTSQWLAGERHALVNTLAFTFMTADPEFSVVIPLFTPQERSYIDLRHALELDLSPYCWAQAAPGGAQLWLGCWQATQPGELYDEAYLVSMPTLATTMLSGQPQLLGWSADGAYAAYTRNGQDGTRESWLLRAGSGQSSRLPFLATEFAAWHPSLPLAALYSAGSGELMLLDAASGQTRAVDAGEPLREAIWQPGAGGILLLSEAGRLLWLADALDPQSALQALTGALPEVHSVRWSPDGKRAAFVSQGNLYVLTIEEGDER